MLQWYSASGAFSYLDDCSLTTLEYDCNIHWSHIHGHTFYSYVVFVS